MFFGSRCRLIMEKIGMLFGSQILIFYAVEFFALLNNSCISDRTIALLFPVNLLALTQPSNVYTFVSQRYKSTMQMCRRICAPPEISIRIFNPLSSFFYSTIAWCRLIYGKNLNVFRISVQADYGKKSECFSDHRSWYFMLSDNISDRTIAL